LQETLGPDVQELQPYRSSRVGRLSLLPE